MRTIRFQTDQKNLLQLCPVHHDIPAEPNREPVEELCDGDKTDSKAKSTNSSKVGDEVQPGHLGSSLVLWVERET